MSHSNEEQLLTDRLREIAEADAGFAAAPDLEARVLANWESARVTTQTSRSRRTRFALAIAAAMVLLIAGSMWFRRSTTPSVPLRVDVIATQPVQHEGVEPASSSTVASPARIDRRASTPARQHVVDFVPLFPSTPGELSGSFQIVRVQVPRAALGALAGRMDVRGSQDPVEADVLLGEDGMARAIRVSTDGNAPWRLR